MTQFKTKANKEIKELMYEKNVLGYELAIHFSKGESWIYSKLRREMSPADKERMIKAIHEISEEKANDKS